MLNKLTNNIEDTNSTEYRRVVRSRVIKEHLEQVEQLKPGMAVSYTTIHGEEVFGSLWSFQDKNNFTIMPVSEECLDRIDRDKGLTYLKFKNAKGVLNKSKVSASEIDLWLIWGKNRYGQESDAYKYLASNMYLALDFLKSRRTKLLVSLPKNVDSLTINEDTDVEIIAKKNIVNLQNYIPKEQASGLEAAKLRFFEKKDLHDKKNEVKTEIELSDLLPEVDGYDFGQAIFFYDETENKIKQGIFIAKNNAQQKYMIDKGTVNSSVTQKRLVESLAIEHVSHNHLDLLKFVKVIEAERKSAQIVAKPIDRQKLLRIKKIQEDEHRQKINEIFDKIDFSQKISLESEFIKLKQLILNEKDARIFFDSCHRLVGNFQHSLMFEFTINEETKNLNQISHEFGRLNFKLDAKKVKHLFNQMIKLKWAEKFNAEFSRQFPDENLLGGISTNVRQKCAGFFNKVINGNVSADQAILYWQKNKNWLLNQVEMIKQANIKPKAEPKQSFWQKGLAKVKSWFGR